MKTLTDRHIARRNTMTDIKEKYQVLRLELKNKEDAEVEDLKNADKELFECLKQSYNEKIEKEHTKYSCDDDYPLRYPNKYTLYDNGVFEAYYDAKHHNDRYFSKHTIEELLTDVKPLKIGD